tara:strand:- start:668 stop:805 length:138 start_codon:yes stop_codon:yes gene_type:complete
MPTAIETTATSTIEKTVVLRVDINSSQTLNCLAAALCVDAVAMAD